MAARPALVRVKRRRHDPVPADLGTVYSFVRLLARQNRSRLWFSAVLEASGGAESSRTNPVNALAALQLSPPAQKKRRFQLVTTLDSGHTTADDLLHQLACS